MFVWEHYAAYVVDVVMKEEILILKRTWDWVKAWRL
jgi:hypothetical protein